MKLMSKKYCYGAFVALCIAQHLLACDEPDVDDASTNTDGGADDAAAGTSASGGQGGGSGQGAAGVSGDGHEDIVTDCEGPDTGLNDVSVYRIKSAFELAAIESCTAIEGSLFLTLQDLETVSLPMLRAVTGELRIIPTSRGNLQHIRLVNLTTIGEFFFVEQAPSLTSVEVPALASVGRLGISETGLAEVSMPSLTTVEGQLGIAHNDSLTSLDFPALETVGGQFGIQSNEMLASSEATTIVEQLDEAPMVVLNCGNSNDAPCP